MENDKNKNKYDVFEPTEDELKAAKPIVDEIIKIHQRTGEDLLKLLLYAALAPK